MAAAKPSAFVNTRVVYCSDNLDHLARLPAAGVDFIYVDPPRMAPICRATAPVAPAGGAPAQRLPKP